MSKLDRLIAAVEGGMSITGMTSKDNPRFGVSPWYVQDGRPMTPTAIGYEGAAFYRYRARLGAEFENQIEFEPSWQWGCLT